MSLVPRTYCVKVKHFTMVLRLEPSPTIPSACPLAFHGRHEKEPKPKTETLAEKQRG